MQKIADSKSIKMPATWTIPRSSTKPGCAATEGRTRPATHSAAVGYSASPSLKPSRSGSPTEPLATRDRSAEPHRRRRRSPTAAAVDGPCGRDR
jgi:hypothetical protein